MARSDHGGRVLRRLLRGRPVAAGALFRAVSDATLTAHLRTWAGQGLTLMPGAGGTSVRLARHDGHGPQPSTAREVRDLLARERAARPEVLDAVKRPSMAVPDEVRPLPPGKTAMDGEDERQERTSILQRATGFQARIERLKKGAGPDEG